MHFIGKYAKDNKIDLQTAKKLLDKSELKSFKGQLDEIIKFFKDNKQDTTQLKLLRAKLRISRLEELKTNIQYELGKLASTNTEQMQDYFVDVYKEQYYKTMFDVEKNIGFKISFTKPDADLIQKAITKNYVLGNYSINGKYKVWQNVNYLTTILEQKIPQGLTLGYNPKKLSKIVEKQLGTDYNANVRLIRTEYNALQTSSSIEAYKQANIKQYKISATLDNRTSEICREMDGEIFDVDKAEQGVNCPPFHPNCRTATIPYFAPDEIDEQFGIGTRLAKDKNGNYIKIPANTNYKDYYNKYIQD